MSTTDFDIDKDDPIYVPIPEPEVVEEYFDDDDNLNFDFDQTDNIENDEIQNQTDKNDIDYKKDEIGTKSEDKKELGKRKKAKQKTKPSKNLYSTASMSTHKKKKKNRKSLPDRKSFEKDSDQKIVEEDNFNNSPKESIIKSKATNSTSKRPSLAPQRKTTNKRTTSQIKTDNNHAPKTSIPAAQLSQQQRKALVDTENRRTLINDDSYNPISEILFGGWTSSTSVTEKKEKPKEVKTKPPCLDVFEEEEEREEEIPAARESLAVGITAPQFLTKDDNLSATQKVTLQRRGSIRLLERRVSTVVENDEKESLATTPNVMLRRPTLGEDDSIANQKSATKLKYEQLKERNSVIQQPSELPEIPKPKEESKLNPKRRQSIGLNLRRNSILDVQANTDFKTQVKRRASIAVHKADSFESKDTPNNLEPIGSSSNFRRRSSMIDPSTSQKLKQINKATNKRRQSIITMENAISTRRSSIIAIPDTLVNRKSCFDMSSSIPTTKIVEPENRTSSSFKNAADRIRRMSVAVSGVSGVAGIGGIGNSETRNTLRKMSIHQTSPRFSLAQNVIQKTSLTDGATLAAAATRNRRCSARFDTENRFSKEKEDKKDLHHENMTAAAEALTQDQIQAFKEAFDLFDNNGGGTIDASELKATLDGVGIFVETEEIEEVMCKLDEDGSGEIDFEEFLNLMTNTEMFLEAFARKKNADDNDQSEGFRDVLLFDALTEFMKKSALKAADEIVGYYSKKYKKVVKTYNMNKGAHVVGHYADGARLIGLTEKQIYRELKRLRMYSNLTSKEQNSPYAQPLHLALLQPKRKKIRRPKRQNSARSFHSDKSQASPNLSPRARDFAAKSIGKNLPKIDIEEDKGENSIVEKRVSKMGGHPGISTLLPKRKIRLKIRNNTNTVTNVVDNRRPSMHTLLTDADQKIILKEQSDILKDQMSQQQRPSRILLDIHKPGWLSQRTKCNNVNMVLPKILSRIPMGRLPALRQAVLKKQKHYIKLKEHKTKENTTKLFRELDSRAAAYTNPLMNQFLAASSAYSCATPDNRIKLDVDMLEIIQKKDVDLREEQTEKMQKMIKSLERHTKNQSVSYKMNSDIKAKRSYNPVKV